MTLRELLPAAPLPQVLAALKRHYEDVPADKVERLYRKLETLPPAADTELEAYISVFRDAGEDVTAVTGAFDEDDGSLCCDVSARGAEEGRVYSIAGLNCRALLALGISEDTLRSFTPANIVAHCLWEATAYGWDPDDREKRF